MINTIKMKLNELEDEADEDFEAGQDDDPVANIDESIRPLFFNKTYEGS